MNIEDRSEELDMLCNEEHLRIYKEYGCKQHCDCVFSKEEIERLVDLTKQPSYRMPSGLTREERRKYMKDVGSRLSDKACFTKEQFRKIGEDALRKYAETIPSDIKAEDFIDLTNVQKESEVGNG